MSVQLVHLLNQTTPVVIPSGLVPKGVYAGGTSYSVGDSVSYNGSSYVCILASTGNLPTDTTYWQVLANKGDTGAKGDTGDTGPAGADGADGADGLTVSVNSVTQVAGNITLDQDDIPDGTTNKAYTATEQSKLSGIEAGADVTDATNVAAAGAIMDGDFSSNGVMTRTASGTYANRTLTGTANQITVVNGNGVSGNPTLSLPQDIHTGASPTFAGETLNGTLNLTNSSLNSGDGNIDLITNKGFQIRNATATAAFRLLPNSNDVYLQNTVSSGNITLTGLNAANLTGAVILKTNTVRPDADSATTLGASSQYWSNTYTDRLYLNSTAYLDGGTAGTANLTGALGILATSGSATHSLTLGSTATGIALYNTADQTTNYERIKMFWASSIFRIYAEQGGSGTNRQILISALGLDTLGLYLNTTSTAGIVESRADTATAGAIIHRINANTLRGASGTQYGLVINGSIAQTSTAGYTALLINPTETATGSGAKLLIDAQVGGASKFKVDNAGKMTTATNTINVAKAKTPSSATDTGTTGDICWDASYVYVCTATNTWKRSAIATW